MHMQSKRNESQGARGPALARSCPGPGPWGRFSLIVYSSSSSYAVVCLPHTIMKLQNISRILQNEMTIKWHVARPETVKQSTAMTSNYVRGSSPRCKITRLTLPKVTFLEITQKSSYGPWPAPRTSERTESKYGPWNYGNISEMYAI